MTDRIGHTDGTEHADRVPVPDRAKRGIRSRRTFLRLGAAGVAGAVATAVVAAEPAAAATARDLGLAGNGTTDDGPKIQAAYDAGVGAIDFEGGKTYLVNTPVFLDATSPNAMLVLNLNGGTLKLGGGLPTTAAFWRDPTVRWAIFPNTKRSAWDQAANVVRVEPATRGTGTGVGGLISLTVRNGTIDGVARNAGFAMSNRTGSRFDGVVLYRARVLLSWADYCDVNVLVQCHNRAGDGLRSSVLVEQIASGDGLLVQSCKADAPIGLLRLKYSRGAEITGTVTGRIELDSCSAVRVSTAHQEAPIANATMLAIKNSTVVVDSSVFYLARSADGDVPPAITIDDSASTTVGTELVLSETQEMRAHEHADVGMGAFVSVLKANDNTKVAARGVTSVTSAPGTGGTWSPTIGPAVLGAGGITAAVAAKPAVLASGDWRVVRRSGAWALEPTVAVAVAATPAVPSILGVTSGTGDVTGGALTATTKVSYVVAVRTADGRTTAKSAKSAGVLPTDKVAKLVLKVDAAPAELLVWRYLGTSSTPDAYAAVPCGAPKPTLYDTGKRLAGVAWQAGTAG
ncbi:hypothetical protein ACGGZK_01905 [Agromyces sp. MMS24-K17]|uniref:hypothetical protein n=1 Tax=Agromyces sp. MMS24-K17 TaxID=3372850 RepID=UPI00375505AF